MSDFLYLLFDKPIDSIHLDLGCPPPGTIVMTPRQHSKEFARQMFLELIEEALYEEPEPLTIEFSL